MVKYKIDTDTAEAEFNRFLESMDLEINPDSFSKEDAESFNTQKGRIIRAIQKGSLVINEGGEPVFTPQRSSNTNPITFYEPEGSSLMAMDTKGQNAQVGKMYSVMAAMTKESVGRFSNMKVSDLNVCLGVATLFLG